MNNSPAALAEHANHPLPPPILLDDVLHEQAVLCASIARLLSRALTHLDTHPLRFADRSRLSRALLRLQEVEQPGPLPSLSSSPLPCSQK